MECNLRLKILNNDDIFKISSKWYFVIDDSLIVEFGKKMEWVGTHFDHTDNKYKKWRTIVALFYVEWEKVYPVDVRPYYKLEEVDENDFKTKNDLALEMIFEHMPEKVNDRPICLFDSWFSWKNFLKSLDDNDIFYVSWVKTNRNIFQEWKKNKLPDLFTHADVAIWQMEWYEKNLIFIKGEYRKEAQNKEVHLYLVSNINTNEPINKIDANIFRKHYDNRWPIEPGFKDLKQLLGWTDLSFKSSLSKLRMIYLSLLVYTIGMKEKVKNNTSKTIWGVFGYFRTCSFREIVKKAHTLWKWKNTLEQTFLAFNL